MAIDYSQIYFGKSLSSLTLDDLNEFFAAPRTETETIEFKSYGRDTFDDQINKSVLRTICAFLNSSGGLLIWGAPVGHKPEGAKEDVFTGPMVAVKDLKGKDSIISLVASRISPSPVSVQLEIVHAESGYIYIYQVGSSIGRPHQFQDKYFIRLDGQTRPAPHYLVEALFKQIQYPEINGYLKFEKAAYVGGDLTLTIRVFICNFSEFQNDERVSYQLVVYPGFIVGNGTGTLYSETYDVIHYGKPISTAYTIHITGREYTHTESIIKLMLSFGGRLSPAKMSTYTLHLDKLPEHHKNANGLIMEMTENLLISEHQRNLGKGKDTFIRDILER